MDNHFLSQFGAPLEAWLSERGHPPYRARQILRWVFQERVEQFTEMTDLPLVLREELAGAFAWWSSQVVRHEQSADGTEKLLLRLCDGGTIECVLLRDGDRRTICISTQVGCAMGCVFCASGLNGVDRNLTTGEILEQMLRLQKLLPPAERLSHIVVMGMGEPLANLNNLLPALDWARNPHGLGISGRRITISTVGLPDAMERLAREKRGYELAVSLHAATDALRNELVRVNSKTGLDAILRAADLYFEQSGRRLTFEYVLLRDINDRSEHADALARRLGRRTALLNVIPFNPVDGLPYKTPDAGTVRRFCDRLTRAGVNVHVRRRKGDEINAACGQLRRVVAGAPTDVYQPGQG